MKIEVEFKLNLKTEEVQKKVEEATRLGLRDTIVAISSDAIKGSPKLTGNNMRSIAAEVSGMGMVASGGEGGAERMVDDNKLEAATYSTSGYGGFLEVGHHTRSGSFVSARPYFRPALDMNAKNLVPNIKRHLE